MADCECLKGCIFFNDKMKNKEALGDIYKKNYCRGENSACARFMVFKNLGREAVPCDLYPNMQTRANELIAGS
ncbi:hypothetical protein KAR48_12200 [bacterium]|nr:hypothetical protein [bacterium]